jgi:hypothetical protein
MWSACAGELEETENRDNDVLVMQNVRNGELLRRIRIRRGWKHRNHKEQEINVDAYTKAGVEFGPNDEIVICMKTWMATYYQKLIRLRDMKP